MKTLVKSFALALSLSFLSAVTTVASANPIGRPSSVATYKTGIYTTLNGKLNVALDKAAGGRVYVRLMDASGNALYTHHLGKKNRGCRLSFNIGDLEDGIYTLEITNGVESTTHNITIATKQAAKSSRIVALN